MNKIAATDKFASLFSTCPDTESARASRRLLRETIFSVLFDMNAPAVCAIDQVCILVV